MSFDHLLCHSLAEFWWNKVIWIVAFFYVIETASG